MGHAKASKDGRRGGVSDVSGEKRREEEARPHSLGLDYRDERDVNEI